MPQKVLKFTGINRVVNEFQGSGACEELINLRPEIGGGHRVIRKKHETLPSVDYEKIYEHSFGNTYNQIAVAANGSIIWFNRKDGIKSITNEFSSNDVELSFAGNVMVAYSKEENKQLVFKYDNDDYVSYDISMKPIKRVELLYSYAKDDPAKNSAIADDSSVEACNAALQKAASGFYGKYPNGLSGAAVVGCAYELDDGSEIWSTAFVVANITRDTGYVIPSLNKEDLSITVTGASKVTLRLYFDSDTAVNVRKINIYASIPVFQYEMEYTGGDTHAVKELPLDDVNLDGQLMYYQGSVVPDEEYKSFLLNFGKDQAGDSLMKVNAGCIDRTGASVSYNNKFHYYQSEVHHIIQVPTASNLITNDRVTNPTYWKSYVEFNGEWKLVDNTYRFSETAVNDFIYPMTGIKRIAFAEMVSGSVSSSSQMFIVDLKDSSAYNYSYAFGVTPNLVTISDEILRVNNVESKVFWKKEANAINVSAPYNPYVFPVEYSYSFGGEIIDIATSYLPISSTQVGQYPLTVFTSVGIFAMEQGDGSVLYSNITPLQPLVLDGKASSTPYGTFFVSSKNLYMLIGRETLNVSDILNGERELYLRELDAYKRLCGNGSGFFYNFLPLLSSEDFEEFIPGATLAYDQLHNELYISSGNENIPYSYVFNLDTKAFHKAARKYAVTQNGARYAIEIVGSDKRVVDMHTEDKGEQPILLQSRPMPIEAFFTHIHRLILFADAKLNDNQYLTVSVFGSDNLNDWKCIISSQKMNTAFRQIRTNRAAKSYRDYVILITGVVDTNTDISELIADYTVVNRRLG
jgi:hypothetical protein